MKPTGTLTALRTGAYLHPLQPLNEAPARLAEFYGLALGSLRRRTVRDLGVQPPKKPKIEAYRASAD